MQFLCGYALERCNLAFINSNRKASDFLTALAISSKNIKQVDDTAGSIFGLIGRSYPVLIMLNGWYAHQIAKVNTTNMSNDEINRQTDAP
jgi:hypothetical protein